MASPSFFKMILNSHTSDSPKFNIPLKFAREHEDIFHTEEIRLKVEGGAEWKVTLEKSNGRVLFDKGWEEFSKFYSLAYGHLLVFRYEGNFCFNVAIYEKSFSEITYPKLTRRDHEEDRPIEDDVFWFENEFEDEEMLDNEKRYTLTLPASTSRADKSKELRKKTSFGRISKRSMATNPSFSVTMGPSYIPTDKGRSYLNIPIAFAKIHLKESQEITLQVSDGTIWRIWCGVRSLEDQRIKVEMRDGWRDFVTYNNLKVGDICVFELMKTTPQISFKVSISQPKFLRLDIEK